MQTLIILLRVPDRLQHLVDDRVLTCLVLLAGRSLRQLHVSNAHHVSEDAVMAAATLLPALEIIDLWGCSRAASDEVVATIAKARGLGLMELLAGGSLRITDASLHALAAHCPTLRGVYFSCCAVTIRGVRRLAAACPGLIPHRVRIHLPGDPLAPIEWPLSAQDDARCEALIGTPAAMADIEEQALADAAALNEPVTFLDD
jgi:hypothetical protein